MTNDKLAYVGSLMEDLESQRKELDSIYVSENLLDARRVSDEGPVYPGWSTVQLNKRCLALARKCLDEALAHLGMLQSTEGVKNG